jgi:hypothetical protein
MSDNPFQSQPSEPTQPAPQAVLATAVPATPPSAPGALTPVLVFCLIFGIFGLIGTCFSGFGVGMIFASEQLFDGIPMPEEQRVFNKISLNAQKGAIIPGIVLMAINLIIATMLIMGAIGCFKRKESSRVFLRMAILAAIIYSVLKIVVTIFTNLSANTAINNAIDKLKNDPMYEGIKAQYTNTQIVSTIVIVVTMVLAVAMLGFYLWARFYLNKSEVVEHFAAVENYQHA